MRRYAPLAALASALLVGACTSDITNPGSSQEVQVIVAPSAGASCTTAPLNQEIVDDINALMAILTPNNSSALSKWQQVLAAIAANDPVAAQAALDNLIGFINLKYGQANTAGVYIGGVPIADFKGQLFLDMQCYVDKNLFDLNPNDPAKVFVDQVTSAGVYFPAGFVPQGYNVAITTPAVSPLTTLFDQYPSFIDIKLVDANGNEPPVGTTFNGTAVVAVCFPGGLPDAVADRLLLGHQARTGFELLPKTNVPQALADALACGDNLQVAMSPAERFLRKAADWLLPEKAYAAFFAFGGVGGSPEEFSPFGAVDPGLSAFGGAGGSPEEFAPGLMPSAGGPAASTLSSGGTHVTGTADESDVTNPAQLPQIRVVTPGSGTGIDGVVVTFELLAPDASGSDPITGPNSSATLCGATTVTTSGGGYASVPCINFGTVPGYKNLRATFDPSGVNPLACIINSLGACATAATSVNFLVETTAGAAAKVVVVSSPSSAQAGEPLSPQPSVRLRDQNDNNVALVNVAVTASLNGGGTLVGDATVETDANGVATFTDLEIQGTIGNRTLTFTATNLASTTTGTIALQPGAAFKLVMAGEPSGTAAAGAAFGTQPKVQVTDEWGNSVATSATVTASIATGDPALAGTLTANTDAAGLAEFSNLRIDGATGDRTLSFASAPLAGVTSATTITVTPGAATKLVMVSQPSTSATAGALFANQPSVKLQDAWNNDVTDQQVTVAAAITSGGAPALAGTTSVLTSSGVASFSNLRIDGVVGSRTLTFTSGTLTAAVSNAINISAGAATAIRTYMSPPTAAASYSYGNLPEGTSVAATPTVLVTDTWGNPVDGAAVTWSPLTAANGAVAVVGSGSSTSGGLAQITSWTTGQGTSTLNASITTSGTAAIFTASAPQVTIAACTVSGSQKKTDLGKYSSGVGGYLGSLTTKAVNAGLIRSAELAMSVTGQSSGTGGYPTAIRAYRVTSAGAKGEQIASGNPYNASAPSDLTLRIPGDNGSPALIKFNLTPVAGKSVAVGEVILFEVQVTAASNRTFQVWYNTKTTAGTTCAESKVITGTLGSYLTTTAIKGVTLSTRNYSY